MIAHQTEQERMDWYETIAGRDPKNRGGTKMNNVTVHKIAQIAPFVFVVTDPLIDHVFIEPASHDSVSLIGITVRDSSEYTLATVTGSSSLIIHGGCEFEFDVTLQAVDDKVAQRKTDDAIDDVIIGLGHNKYGEILCPQCGTVLCAHIALTHYGVQLGRELAPSGKAYEGITYDPFDYDDSESDILYPSVGCPDCGWAAIDHVH